MGHIIGLKYYDKKIVDEICNTDKISHVVLGDLFCQYRMFENASYDIPFFSKKLTNNGKKIIIQTPMYLTSRNLLNEIMLIQYLVDNVGLEMILVQDIGVATLLKKKYPDINLCWSRMGRVRNSLINYEFINYLKNIGISSIENDRERRIEEIIKSGLINISVYGNLYYNTFSRECYTKYELNIFDINCNRECDTRRLYLRDKDSKFQMSINGYLLGETYVYNNNIEFKQKTEENSSKLIIYCKDLVDFETRTKKWNMINENICSDSSL